MITTADIIKQLERGDNSGFEQLVRDNEKHVYSLCLRMTGNAEDAYDLSQETFVKAYRSLVTFKMESALSTWLYRIASNTCLDFLRKRKRIFFFTLNDKGEDDFDQVPEIPDSRYCPETELEKKELRENVAAALLKLSPLHRQIVVLRDLSGLAYSEISEILDISEGTVKSRLARAREQLRRALGNISQGAASKD